MKRSKSIIGSLAVASLLFTGCGGTTPLVPYNAYKFEKANKETPAPELMVKNGVLEIQNGEKIFDDDGDIIYGHKTEKKIFYVLKKRSDSEEFVVKDTTGKYKKELKANKLKFYSNGYIAARLNTQNSAVFDNLWHITDEGLKLTAKNLRLNGYTIGRFDIEPIKRYSEYGSYLIGYHITDIPTAKVIESDFSEFNVHTIKLSNTNERKSSLNYRVLGASGDNLLLTYRDTMSKNALGIYNVSNDASYTLMNTETHNGAIQFLANKNDKILRVFEDATLTKESQTIINGANQSVRDSMTTAYNDKLSKFYNLSTLKEVAINPKKYRNVKIAKTWSNLGGGRNTTYYITYTLDNVLDIYDQHGYLILEHD